MFILLKEISLEIKKRLFFFLNDYLTSKMLNFFESKHEEEGTGEKDFKNYIK